MITPGQHYNPILVLIEFPTWELHPMLVFVEYPIWELHPMLVFAEYPIWELLFDMEITSDVGICRISNMGIIIQC